MTDQVRAIATSRHHSAALRVEPNLRWSQAKPAAVIAVVAPIRERPIEIDRRFVALHQKCAAGTILPDELAELEMIEAMKIEAAK